MTTISDKDRAELQAMYEAFHGCSLSPLGVKGVSRWLAVRDQVLATHECPSTDRRPLEYYRHPRLDGRTECPECGYPMHEHGWLDCGGDGIVVCPSLHGPFGGQAVTDYARNHTCGPEWRPTTSAEIQPGWEIRARHSDGSEATWGTAHHRDNEGNWRAKEGRLLTWDTAGWTYETTAPRPAQDPRIAVVMEWYGSTTADHDGIADLLTRLDNLKAVEYSEPNSN